MRPRSAEGRRRPLDGERERRGRALEPGQFRPALVAAREVLLELREVRSRESIEGIEG